MTAPTGKPYYANCLVARKDGGQGAVYQWIELVGARPLHLLCAQEVDLCIHRWEHHDWRVTEGTSGYIIGEGPTRAEAIEHARATIDRFGLDRILAGVAASIEKTGLSPRYAEQADVAEGKETEC